MGGGWGGGGALCFWVLVCLRRDSAIIIATNPNTNNIAKRLNFIHYKSLNWSDYKDSLTGQDWFPEEKLPYTIVNSYYKLLQQSDFC